MQDLAADLHIGDRSLRNSLFRSRLDRDGWRRRIDLHGDFDVREPQLRALARLVSLEQPANAHRIKCCVIARNFVDSELADFCWNARQREAWIGEYESLDDDVGTSIAS